MAASNETLLALNEVHGVEKPDDIGFGEWVWGALQGDFNPERSSGQIGFDMVVSLFPVVDTICDLRDLCANIRAYRADPNNKVTLFFIATTVVGFFPEVGTVVKSALRLVWVYLKPLIKHADDITNTSKLVAATNRACDAALPKITEYLQHSRVMQWATKGKLPDVFKLVATKIREGADLVSPARLRAALNEKLDALRALLQKIKPLVPSTIQEKIADLLELVESTRNAIGNAIQQFCTPIRTVLKVIAKRLDDHAWRAEVYRTNRGWIAPISQTGSAKLINAKPPKWVHKISGKLAHPPTNPADSEVRKLINANPGHPQLSAPQIATFSRANGGIRPDTIAGPAKLYRIIDPSNEGAGVFWVSESEFRAIKNREEWRSKFAVKPEWNQNGWFVEYEIKAGENLPVWRGPAASQQLDGTDYYLKGGGEQIVFFPGNRDQMVDALPRIDRDTGSPVLDDAGNIDKRVEYTDVTGQITPSKLRAKIIDPHIKGPLETGWGASDYMPDEAKRILLTVPTPA